MQNKIIIQNTLKAYFEKQRSFKALVKDVQQSLQSKEYKLYSCTFDEFIKSRWNISKAQAYRYLISAKVIDQLEEFNILPCYERICRSLYNCAKTQNQMKLLWGAILQSAGNRPDCINSSHVTKMWKKLCSDKKYNKICHYEDEIMNKIEKSLNKNSKDVKRKQLHKETKQTSPKIVTQLSYYPSPCLNVPVIPSNDSSQTTTTLNNNNNNNNIIYIGNPNTSQISQYPSPTQNESIFSLNESISYSIPSSSSPASVCSSQLSNEATVDPLNSTFIAVPTVNLIERPVLEVQYSPQPISIQDSKLFSNYQEQTQPVLHNNQVLYYY